MIYKYIWCVFNYIYYILVFGRLITHIESWFPWCVTNNKYQNGFLYFINYFESHGMLVDPIDVRRDACIHGRVSSVSTTTRPRDKSYELSIDSERAAGISLKNAILQ